MTNADRVVFPDLGTTKGEVVSYYESVAPRMLPFVQGRALTVERYPKGIGGKGFMQKNAPEHLGEDLIGRHRVPKGDGGVTVYPVINDARAIPTFANLGVLTFHAPASTVRDERHSDWAIWDLDPPRGASALVREVAHLLGEQLGDFGIPAVPMTSGSNGYHLRARLAPPAGFDHVSVAVRGTAALAAAAHPGLMTLAFKKRERGNRVFLDWLRNAPYSTSVVPWSLRARSRAPIAVPITWHEIDTIDPDGIRLENVEERFDLNPWGELQAWDVLSSLESIEEALAQRGIDLEPFDRFRS